MRDIRGKTALVTGAASGIGRAIALRLAEEGARVYLLDVNAVQMADVVAEARQRGVDALGRQCDLSQPKQITSAVEHLLDRWGGVDILVNNAGITYYGRTMHMSAQHWNQILAINLHAPIQLVRELLPTLTSRAEAHILNISSICGLIGMARVTAYTTTKFALVGFGESLRAELVRQGVGVSTLCPGFVDTRLFKAAPKGADDQRDHAPPRWMLTSPERIANRAVRAIYRNDGLVVIQPYARVVHFFKRMTPGLIEWAHGVSRRRRVVVPDDAAAREAARRAA